MSLYTKARKYIDMKRVKEMREEKIKREKIAEILRQQEEIRAELEYIDAEESKHNDWRACLLYTSPSPRDQRGSRMPSSA